MSKKPPVKATAKKKRIEKDVTNEFVELNTDELLIREFKWTPKQKQLIDLILDKKTKIVMLKGDAGTAKSLISIYCGLQLIKDKKHENLVYIRSVVESAAKSLGFLPGDIESKVGPFFLPLQEKLDELLPFKQVNSLAENGIVKAIPNNFLRGTQFRSYVFVDEAQGFERFELQTILTRFANGGKFILAGDMKQADCKKSGFADYYDLFDNQESRDKGIFCFSFGREDIMRAEILKFICDKLDTLK